MSRSTYQDPYAAPADMMGNGYQAPGVGVGGSAGGYGDASGGYNTNYAKPPMERGGGDFRSSAPGGYAPPPVAAGGYASSYDGGYGGRQDGYGGARPAADNFSGGV